MARTESSLASRVAGIAVKNVMVLLVLEFLVRALGFVGVIQIPNDTRVTIKEQFLARSDGIMTSERLSVRDADLLYAMRPSFRETYSRNPIFSDRPRTYTVATNAQGLRNPEVSIRKPDGLVRIACLGDSSTFGYNLEEKDSYPRVLERLLNREHPGRFQVVNFGTSGYTSRQGLEQLRLRVMEYQPDVVTMAFGTNDLLWQMDMSDDERIRSFQRPMGRMILSLSDVMQNVASYRWMHYVLFKLGAIDPLARESKTRGRTKSRVSGPELMENIRQAAQIADLADFRLIVMNLDYTPARAGRFSLRAAREAGVSSVDAILHVRTRQLAATRSLERQLGLDPAPRPQKAQPGSALLRVRVPPDLGVGEIRVKYGFFLSANNTEAAMFDDGTHGDQQPGDGIWSLRIPPKAPSIRYAFFHSQEGTGKLVKEFVDTYSEVFRKRPADLHLIDDYGKMFLQADASHPDEEGTRMIARLLKDAILEEIRADAVVKNGS